MPELLRSLVQLYRDSFSGLAPRVWLLALVMLVNRSGAMVVAFLSVYLISDQGFSPVRASYVMAAFGAGGILGNYLGGILNDRYGSWHLMLFSLIGAGGMSIFLGRAEDYVMICAAAFGLSLIADAFRPANRAAIAIYATPETLTQSYGLQRIAVNLGLSIGPALGGFLAYNYGYELLFWADGITFWLAAGLFLLVLPKDETARPLVQSVSTEEATVDVRSTRPAHRQPWLLTLCLANTCMMICFFQIFITTPAFLLESGYTEKTIGLLLTVNALLIVLAEMPLVFTAERKYRAVPVMLVGGTLIALSYAFLPLSVTLGTAALVAFSLLVSVGEIYFMPFTATYVARWAPPARRGEYLGVLSASYSLAFIVCPLFCFWISEHYGYPTSYYATAGLAGVSLLLLLRMDRLREVVRPTVVEAQPCAPAAAPAST